jgi:hypothetical protein
MTHFGVVCVVFFVIYLVVTLHEHCKQLIIHCARNQVFLIMMVMHFVLFFQIFHNVIIKYLFENNTHVLHEASLIAHNTWILHCHCFYFCNVVGLQVTKLGSLQHRRNTIFFIFFPLLPPQIEVQEMSTWMIIAPSNPQPKNSPSHK